MKTKAMDQDNFATLSEAKCPSGSSLCKTAGIFNNQNDGFLAASRPAEFILSKANGPALLAQNGKCISRLLTSPTVPAIFIGTVRRLCFRNQTTGLSSNNRIAMSYSLRPDWYSNQGWSVSANRTAPKSVTSARFFTQTNRQSRENVQLGGETRTQNPS